MIVKYRIKKHEEFQKVIADGQLIKSQSFTFYVLENTFGYTRFGVSVPKKSGNAVIRNKIKRQVRASVALATDYSLSYDIVAIIRKNYDISKFSETVREIQELFNKIGQKQ